MLFGYLFPMFVCRFVLVTMVVKCSVLCGADCKESTYYEEGWAQAAMDAGICDDAAVFAPPEVTLGQGWGHWWVTYEAIQGESFDDTTNAPHFH